MTPSQAFARGGSKHSRAARRLCVQAGLGRLPWASYDPSMREGTERRGTPWGRPLQGDGRGAWRGSRPARWAARALLALVAVPFAVALAVPGSAAPRQDLDDELEALLAEERAEAEGLLARGRHAAAERILAEHLEEDPDDSAARELLARVRWDQGRAQEGLQEAERASAAAGSRARAAADRTRARLLAELGRGPEAEALLPPEVTTLEGAWARVAVLDSLGRREEAFRAARAGAALSAEGASSLILRGRCRQRAGDLVGASRDLVEADRASGGRSADALVALAAVYFESEQEVEAAGKRSVGLLLREALELCPGHEEGLLLQFDLHRLNRRRNSRTPEEILRELLDLRPGSVRGLIKAAENDLADGQLVRARARLRRLEELAPMRREVRALQAALAWIEHRRPDAMALLEELAAGAEQDSVPARTVGELLLQLYRFAEAVPFLAQAVERDPSDHVAWGLLGRARANAGDEEGGLEALVRAEAAAAGRQDAQRHNLKLVLERTLSETVTFDGGELEFVWMQDAAAVFEAYLVPFYQDAREQFAARYGHTPGRTRVEVFRRFSDFSVRSVGFEGFPALGVCFGPVVTSVSPLAEIRGTFSWARTAWHEFSHVVHLGLSHNRCPRWITEGLATWEETERNPSWTRNMRRDLVDALACGTLIPVRELNRAFRGPRILFGYYQGGLLCEMLIGEQGFAPLVGLLEAFDEGLDLDQAFQRELGATPEQVDVRFEAFVRRKVANLDIEPRHDPAGLALRGLRAGRKVPEEGPEREAWQQEWLGIAWGRWQQKARLDAEQALLRAREAGPLPPRGLFLEAEMRLTDGDGDGALALLEEGVAAGGTEYRALMTLGKLLEQRGRAEDALARYAEAEQAFPGFDQPQLSAERAQAQLHEAAGREEQAFGAWERWLAWNPGEYDLRVRVAGWHATGGRHADAARLLAEANEVDPFRRDLHRSWGEALLELERFAEAEREFRVALAVPAALDADHGQVLAPPGAAPRGSVPGTLPPRLRRELEQQGALRIQELSDAERAELLELRALALEGLGDAKAAAEARAAAADLGGS